jgi:hypothetical protein
VTAVAEQDHQAELQQLITLAPAGPHARPSAPCPADLAALAIARQLVDAGVPLFVAPPCPAGCKRRGHGPNTEFDLPPKWETSTPNIDVIGRWRPGWALCAVMGHTCDLLDVDPRNGGHTTAEALKAAGAWPRSYGRAATPSGGIHAFVAPLHAGSRDGVQPGLDVKGGRPDGTSRGFAYIAPTVRISKTTGQPEPYRWLEEPDLSDTEGDDTGAHLTELVNQSRSRATAAAPAGPPAGDQTVLARVDQLATELAQAPEGSGNNEATRIGYMTGQYVGAGQITLNQAAARLQAGLRGWTWRDDASRDGVYMSLQRALEDGAGQPRPWAASRPATGQADDLDALVPGWRAASFSAAEVADLDVTNAAEAARWLRNSVGRGRLAGLFDRAGGIVFIAREGEAGYAAPRRAGDHDGPAQVRVINAAGLAAYIDTRYSCFRLVKVGEDFEARPALFPGTAAGRVVDLPDPDLRPGLRRLAGVVHTPVVRADGTLLDPPGYDPATRLYYLPDPHLTVPQVPETPTPEQVKTAVALLDEMTAGFPWKSDHDRAGYYGFLLTPLLRSLVPPPYKLFVFDAPQQGTGKTLLAEIGRILHGGVLRGGVQHGDDAEVRKTVTTVLMRTTGPVVLLDNLTGTLDSPVLSGLLTSADWSDRLLGATEELAAVNDRLWCATANNLTVGVDMVRRITWVGIDAQMPRPQERTGFAIANLPGWVRARRGELLHALLVLIRAWVVAGRPVRNARTSDQFAAWTQTVDGILTHTGLPGRFADPSTQRQETGEQDDDWGEFLTAVHAVLAQEAWTVKELLDRVPTGTGIIPPAPGSIPVGALPGDLAEKALRHPLGPAGVARSLGMWLRNRDGRYVGQLTARRVGTDRHDKRMWRIVPLSTGSPAGTAGTAGTISAYTRARPNEVATDSNGDVEGQPPVGPGSPGSPGSPGTLPCAASR